MSTFHAIAAAVVAESTSPDPGDMAAEFVARIPPARYREALLFLARGYLGDAIRHQRTHVTVPRAADGVASRKVQSATAAWKRLLDGAEFVPSVGWLFLRDATAAQVAEIAAMRQKQADELSAAASRYAELAAAMKRRRVLRVADLPDDVLARILDGAHAA